MSGLRRMPDYNTRLASKDGQLAIDPQARARVRISVVLRHI